ncbi:Cytosolic prostaglandin E synthase [Paragonimus heterotremus]|uniref:Cytosolic prostaglandin E synthase n=1 Tax=Paragonimus heterotremus TaxID=100268 RepID=A0A8J4TD40_9TREM|nr:Cytosolic prostaglandin E synthase [Paragonimus heterotremus]
MSGDQPTTYVFGVLVNFFFSLTPPVLWAQRKDALYVTISLGDVKDKKLDLKEGSLYFRGKSGTPKSSEYEIQIEFYGQVDPEGSRQLSTDREIVMYIKKKEMGFWPRLLSSSKKVTWLKVDFNRWVDENDSEPEAGGMDNFNSMLSQMSNFNDYGADDADIDSDDDDLPDLEPPTKATEESAEDVNGKAEEEEKQPVAQEASA